MKLCGDGIGYVVECWVCGGGKGTLQVHEADDRCCYEAGIFLADIPLRT